MPEEQWSEPEKWVWLEIRAGRPADFNELDKIKDTPLDQGGPQKMSRSTSLCHVITGSDP